LPSEEIAIREATVAVGELIDVAASPMDLVTPNAARQPTEGHSGAKAEVDVTNTDRHATVETGAEASHVTPALQPDQGDRRCHFETVLAIHRGDVDANPPETADRHELRAVEMTEEDDSPPVTAIAIAAEAVTDTAEDGLEVEAAVTREVATAPEGQIAHALDTDQSLSLLLQVSVDAASLRRKRHLLRPEETKAKVKAKEKVRSTVSSLLKDPACMVPTASITTTSIRRKWDRRLYVSSRKDKRNVRPRLTPLR